jgi:CBS domain-containing protein
MKVRDLMSSALFTCRPADSLAHAARLMWEHDCGLLPVLDRDGRVGAVITDRDVCMGASTRGSDLESLRVADSMSKTLVTCLADDDVTAAADRMVQHQLRRLPVVDAAGKAIGLLTLNDLAGAADHAPQLARQAMQVLTAVGRHRSSVPVAPMAAAPAAPAAPTVAPRANAARA